MKRFSEYDPIVIAIYFFSVTGVAMFCGHPLISGTALVGGALYYVVANGGRRIKPHLFFLALFLILALANPLVSHNGVTVLFVMNDNPITLEALLYGINSAATIVGALYWFRSFTIVMTSEKLLYVTGALSPKLSLVLSMSLRYAPMLRRQSKAIADAQKATGAYKDDNIVDDIRCNTRIFSILSTWALENGIITADSMAARGYGVGRRTSFNNYRMRRGDIALLIVDIALLAVCVAAIAGDRLEFAFYPKTKLVRPDGLGMAGAAAYGLLALTPVIIETEANLRWKYLKSKI